MSKKAASTEQKPTAKVTVSPQTFVTEWKSEVTKGGSISKLAERLGMKAQAVNARAAHYRKLNVLLPKFPRHGRSPIKVDELNALLS